MRDVLFRGKCELGKCWRSGSLVIREDTYGNVQYEIIKRQGEKYVVIPDTISQYTGLKDKNGKKIFEGDILQYFNDDNTVHYITIVFKENAFLVEDGGVTDTNLLTSYVCLGLEVISNIHDNPELLKNT